jgi:outer membrane protein
MIRPDRTWVRTLTIGVFVACLPAPGAGQVLTLKEVAQAALETHPSVEASRARLDGAVDGLAMARAQRLPGVQLDASLTRFQEPMIVAPLHSLNLSSPPGFDDTLVQGRLGVGYTLFDGNARGSRIEGATALRDAAQQGGVASEQALLEKAAAAFFALGSARAVLEGAEAQAAALDEEYARAQRHFEAGTAARVELLRAGAARQEALAQRAGAAARVGLSERELARVMGVEPAAVSGRLLDSWAVPPVEYGPNGVVETSAAGSPMIDQAMSAVGAAAARLSEAKAGRFPRLDVGAGVLDFGTLNDRHIFEWQAGMQVSWPLFTGGGRSASVRRAESDVRLARAELARVELEVASGVDAAQTALTEALAQATALESAVEQWAEVARIEALAMEAGSGIQSDLLRAQAGLFQARAGLARAEAAAAQARVTLERARGTLEVNWMNGTSEGRP